MWLFCLFKFPSVHDERTVSLTAEFSLPLKILGRFNILFLFFKIKIMHTPTSLFSKYKKFPIFGWPQHYFFENFLAPPLETIFLGGIAHPIEWLCWSVVSSESVNHFSPSSR